MYRPKQAVHLMITQINKVKQKRVKNFKQKKESLKFQTKKEARGCKLCIAKYKMNF